jgi:hypothetical protein
MCGRGVARGLLWFAPTLSIRFARDIGCLGVVTHPLGEGVRDFCRRHGLADLPFDPASSMLVRMTDLVHNGF